MGLAGQQRARSTLCSQVPWQHGLPCRRHQVKMKANTRLVPLRACLWPWQSKWKTVTAAESWPREPVGQEGLKCPTGPGSAPRALSGPWHKGSSSGCPRPLPSHNNAFKQRACCRPAENKLPAHPFIVFWEVRRPALLPASQRAQEAPQRGPGPSSHSPW